MSLVDENHPAHFGRPVGSSETFEVRSAIPTDAEGVAALFVQCVGGSGEEHRQGFLRELAAARPDNLVLVAQSAGLIIGFARARHFEPPAPSSEPTAPAGWYLLGVDVLPVHRRQGVGTELTRERLRWSIPGRWGHPAAECCIVWSCRAGSKGEYPKSLARRPPPPDPCPLGANRYPSKREDHGE